MQKPSVTSLVYNHDRFATKYTTITKLQDPRHEVIIELKEMMRTAILDFMGKADRPVVNIVFYRDGVSEGEYERIREAEIGAINGKGHILSVAVKLLISAQRQSTKSGPRARTSRIVRRWASLLLNRSLASLLSARGT